MTFAGSIGHAIRHTFDFKGAAKRSEYWYFALFLFLSQVILGTVDSVISASVGFQFQWLENIAAVVLSIPQLAVTARRYHDAGFSAKWLYGFLAPALAFVFAWPTLQALSEVGVPTDAEIVQAAGALGPFLISMSVVAALNLAITLRSSKAASLGNRYVKPGENDVKAEDLKNQGW